MASIFYFCFVLLVFYQTAKAFNAPVIPQRETHFFVALATRKCYYIIDLRVALSLRAFVFLFLQSHYKIIVK